MPKALLDYLGYVIYFWIGDGTEPVHVHISPGKQTNGATKVWIKKNGVELAHNKSNIPQNDLRRLLRFIDDNKDITSFKMSPTSLGGGKQTLTAGEHISQLVETLSWKIFLLKEEKFEQWRYNNDGVAFAVWQG